MGICNNLARLTQLQSQINDFEQKEITISRAKTDLASNICDYQMTLSGMDPSSAEYKTFQERIDRLNQVEKRLDEKLTKIQTQLQFAEAEIGKRKEGVQTNIQKMYA